MKKTLFTIFALAAILVSCTKESETVKFEGRSNVFTATFSDDFGVKTSLSDGKQVAWEQNDEITINRISFSAEAAGTTSAFNQQSGTAEVTAPYHAFYPASIAGSGASGTLPAAQTYTPDKATNLPMYAYSDSAKSLTFKNICGVLKIKVPSGYQVNTITVSTTDNKALHGAFTVKGDSVAVMNVTSSVPAANKTLTVYQTSNTNTEILVAIPAATYSNLTITVYGASNDVVVCTGTINNFTIAANHIKKITLKDYFYIEAVEEGYISLLQQKNAKENAMNLQYSTDRVNWYTFYNNTGQTPEAASFYTEVGKRYYFRAPQGHINTSFGNNENTSSENVYKFQITNGKVKIGGDIMYLLNNDGNHNILNSRAFSHIFSYTTVIDASALKLPSELIADYCYQGMFEQCTLLVAAPKIPDIAPKAYCYQYMFNGCTSLVTSPELPATSLSEGCYKNMFSGCTSLTKTPALLALTLAASCYEEMFNGCSSINSVIMKATDVSANNCLKQWLNNAGEPSSILSVCVSDTIENITSEPGMTIANNTPTKWSIINDDPSGIKIRVLR